MWKEGCDRFVLTRATRAHLENGSGPEERSSWNIFAVNDKLDMVEFDLMQWMHLSRGQRTELLIDYARRPYSGTSKPEDTVRLQVIVPTKAMEVAAGGGLWHGTGRIVDVYPDDHLELKG